MPDRTNYNEYYNDAASAMKRLLDAGDDVSKLIEAVKSASFLENVPSPERQTLRASKRKLKRALLKADADSRKSLFQSAGDDSEKLKKFVESDMKFKQLCDTYLKLKWRIVKMPGGATRKADMYYKLFGLMKQALEGDLTEDCPMFADNGNIDFHGRFVWDSWNVVKGMPNEEAKKKFVDEFFGFSSSALYKDSRREILA
ncbi:ACB domain-containing protein [Chloropicon primus]|uniref:ACB domain-containing protein n=1 Tax=Chloropicon primus TaxID=1764295 RepID=A0A5B8MU57_9CHLO|nr:hypothetical protein A3770_11p63740 [Chloropicon primus]UPR03069.1 ACB domain-containing protein [Chloropicon primus]|mmetsp:Transcript_5490/g.16693  ORF Transcript_5490/g.16693 Transcript_5490/m.16693 type:complete len:200 (+) Transcript_5490:718-1317(+)|eukprot:QDZ23856.1 hypothetical protein A3770_11p63740 [Chloropicon primus]